MIFRVIRCLGAGFNCNPAASGVRAAWVWGNLNNGGNGGVSCRNSNNGPWNANWNGSLGAPGTIIGFVYLEKIIASYNPRVHCENNLKPTRLVPIRESHGSNQMNLRRLTLKTYCKPAKINIEDWKFNEKAVIECFRNKRGRNDFQRLLCRTGIITKREIAQDRLSGDLTRVMAAETAVAQILTQQIIDRDLKLPPIRQFQRVDGLTQKLRDICQESPEQQVYEYIAVYALMPLFKAKILPIQYGSIPKKGGVAGKRKIERLLRRKFRGKVSAVKGDVTKAYPSVLVMIVMEMLRRDIGKNKVLLWFLGALMANYPGNHLCIGGYLPAWLFNYVMSYVLRFLYEQAQVRREKRHRLVYAIVCYADDFTIYGDLSKLRKAMKKATAWAHDKLGLKIKDIWQFYHISSLEEEKKNHEERRKGSKKRTPGVDMMGYVIRRRYTIIRGRVFRRIRRQILRAWHDYKMRGFVPWWRACRIAAYKGWIDHSNSQKFRLEYCFNELFKLCAYSASKHGKEVEREKRILLIEAAYG